MEFAQVFTVFAGWVAISVPASLLLGACIAMGAKEPQPRLVPVSRAFDAFEFDRAA